FNLYRHFGEAGELEDFDQLISIRPTPPIIERSIHSSSPIPATLRTLAGTGMMPATSAFSSY
ncbi:MAG: hypothetical protein ACKOB4_03625, partial [Acidobacteriota bacterium]